MSLNYDKKNCSIELRSPNYSRKYDAVNLEIPFSQNENNSQILADLLGKDDFGKIWKNLMSAAIFPHSRLFSKNVVLDTKFTRAH